MVDFSSVNGQFGGSLELQDRGLAYGDGLFETMRFQSGRIPLLQRHLARLSAGCKRLFIPFDRQRLKQYLDALIQKVGLCDGVIKLIVTRGVGGSGYIAPAPEHTHANIILQFTSQTLKASQSFLGVTLHTCQQLLSLNPLLAGLKHLNRLEYVLAAQDVPSGSNQMGVLLSAEGCVIESLHHNLFIVKGDKLLTPKLDKCGVEGVMRGLLLDDLFVKLGSNFKVSVSNLSIEDVYSADEVFLSNSVRGVCYVSSFNHRQWSKGPIVSQLHGLIEQSWGNENGGS